MNDSRRDGVSSKAALNAMSDDQIVSAFLSLERAGISSFAGADIAIRAFLFEAYLRFATNVYPGTVSDGTQIAPRILDAFAVAEGLRSPKTIGLRLSTLKARVAERIGYKPTIEWPDANVSDLLEELEICREVLTPNSPLQADIEAAQAMLDGAHGPDVRTTITASLPHPLVRRIVQVGFSHAGLSASIALTPQSPTGDVFEADAGGLPLAKERSGAGAWAIGSCNVEIAFNGVLDWTASVASFAVDDGPPQLERSPAVAYLVAEILRAILGALAQSAPEELAGLWFPLPADVRAITTSIGTEHNPTQYHMQSLPMGGMAVTVLDAPSVEMTLGEVEPVEPWEVARAYAAAALASGRCFDAVVWANVAIEALIDERLEEFANKAGIESDEFMRGTSVFAEAEEIISVQRPELAGQIQWPVLEKAPSRFRQIKSAAKTVALVGSAKELISAYTRVSQVRNDVMHGRSIDAVSPLQARTATSALDSFVELFALIEA